MTLLPGIYGETSAAEYHADPCEQPSLSASIAHVLCERSPRHAWAAHPKLNPRFARTEESRFDVGTAAHAILLEGKMTEQVVEVCYFDDWRSNAAKEARDAARAAGRVPLLEKQADDVYAMLDATHEQLDAYEPRPFTDGKPEQALVWEEDGVTCRALVDWLRDDYTWIDDFKTTSASAHPERWSRTLFTIGADIQTAFHLRGLRALTGVRARMRYVVQETYPPYALSVIELGPDVLTVANAKVEYAIARWRRCLADDDWPAYTPLMATAELPPWEDARWAGRLAIEEDVAA